MVRRGISGYKIVSEIATNETCEIYKAETPNGKECVIKMYNLKHADLGQLEDECEINRRLCGDYILNSLDIFEDGFYKCIVLPYAEYGDLYDYVSRHKINEELATRIALQILTAVEQIHSLNIVHRDIKPENILISDYDRNGPNIVLSDFGLATFLNEDEMATKPCGTSYYAAPEIYTGQPYNEEVDIWSLGVTLYFLITGDSPFSINDSYEMISEICAGEYNFNGYKWKNISEDYKDLISRMLKIDPNERISAAKAKALPIFTRLETKNDQKIEQEFSIDHLLLQDMIEDAMFGEFAY